MFLKGYEENVFGLVDTSPSTVAIKPNQTFPSHVVTCQHLNPPVLTPANANTPDLTIAPVKTPITSIPNNFGTILPVNIAKPFTGL